MKELPKAEELLRGIHQWLHKDWEITFKHVFREVNTCADWLAKLGVNQRKRRVIWISPPSDLERFLLDDFEGRESLRYVT